MSGLLKILILFSFCLNIIHGFLQSNMISEYFKTKNVGKINILSCDNKYDQAHLSIFLQNNNLFTTIININRINNEIISTFYSEINQLGFVIDADCEKNIKEILEKSGTQMLFGDKYPWLIFSTNETIFDKLAKINLYVNAEIVVAFFHEQEKKWDLIDVYNPSYVKGGTLRRTNIGTWNKGIEFNDVLSVPKYLRRKDLSEITLKGIITLIHPYPKDLMNYLHNNDSIRGVDNYSRGYFLLMRHLKDLHNFSLTVNVTKWLGTKQKDGNFKGLVGFLQRKESDIGLSAIYNKVDRLPHVDFTVPTYYMKTQFIFRHPKPALTVRGTFFEPLSNIVWICTWGVMVLTAFIIRVTFQQECKIFPEKYDNYMEHDWSYISLLIFGGICQQDVPRVPNLYSGRTVVFASVLFTYMLYQFYSGGIVSSLLSEPPRLIRNLKDLLDSTLQIGVEDIVYERDYFDQTNDPIAIALFKTKMAGKKNGSDAYYDVETGMELVRRGGFAFQTDTGVAYEFVADEYSNEIICELGEVQLYPIQYMIGVVQQYSPFRELFVYGFQRMVEAGQVNGQRLRWTTRKPECIKIVDASTIFAGFNEFFPALLFYVIGVFFAFIIFFVEVWYYRKRMNQFFMASYWKKMFFN